MTASVTDRDDEGAGGLRRALTVVGAAIAALFGAGVATGILLAHGRNGGGALSPLLIAILMGVTLLTVAAAAVCWRGVRRMAQAAGTPRDRRNSVVLAVCGLVGAAMGIGLVLVGDHDGAHVSIFDEGPIAPVAAVALALAAGVIIPLLSLYWHRRVVDEQEAAAYSRGTLIAMTLFWCAAPTWWFLWRGGLAPAPDGVLLYMATMVVAGAVWFHGRYR